MTLNLVSFSLEDQWLDGGSINEDFLSTFRTCLRQSAIEICLKEFYRFPFSILDDAKNLKKLTLSNCTAMSGDEPVSASGLPHRSLETLVIDQSCNSGILLWATHRATNLKTLELRGLTHY
jgi:hypothetical protein